VTSVLNLSDTSKYNCIKQLNNYLAENSNEEMKKIFKSSNCLGLLLNERFVNLSPKLSLPCYKQLIEEIKKRKLNFEYIIMISKVLHPKTETRDRKTSEKGKKKKEDTETIFLNAEDEMFEEKCLHKSTIDVSNQCDGDKRDGQWDEDDQSYSTFRHILLFKASDWYNVVDQLEKIL